MKNGLGNLAASTVDQLAATMGNRLRRIQHQPALISGFLAQSGRCEEDRAGPGSRSLSPRAAQPDGHFHRPARAAITGTEGRDVWVA